MTLASPEHKQDAALESSQHGDRVHFKVPQVGVYEIAVIQIEQPRDAAEPP